MERREHSTHTQIIRNVRKVTNSELVRQTYQSVSKHCTLLHYRGSRCSYLFSSHTLTNTQFNSTSILCAHYAYVALLYC